MQSPVTKLFNIEFPIIQGGMIWCSGWELATAVSRAGGLGLIGAGSGLGIIPRENFFASSLGYTIKNPQLIRMKKILPI